MHTKNNRTFLCTLAKRAIEHYFDTGTLLYVSPQDVDPALCAERGTFVTLTLDGELRGCIGHVVPVQPLYKDVIENAVNAAFHDPRFDPLTQDEFPRVKIEISILSIPEPLPYKGASDLLQKLHPGVHGVILQKGIHSATFLPQVWEEIPNRKMFLSHLCQKAGLASDSWEKGDLAVQTYTVEYF